MSEPPLAAAVPAADASEGLDEFPQFSPFSSAADAEVGRSKSLPIFLTALDLFGGLRSSSLQRLFLSAGFRHLGWSLAFAPPRAAAAASVKFSNSSCTRTRKYVTNNVNK